MSCSSWVIQELCGLPGVVAMMVRGRALKVAAQRDDVSCEPDLKDAAGGDEQIDHDVVV